MSGFFFARIAYIQAPYYSPLPHYPLSLSLNNPFYPLFTGYLGSERAGEFDYMDVMLNFPSTSMVRSVPKNNLGGEDSQDGEEEADLGLLTFSPPPLVRQERMTRYIESMDGWTLVYILVL